MKLKSSKYFLISFIILLLIVGGGGLYWFVQQRAAAPVSEKTVNQALAEADQLRQQAQYNEAGQKLEDLLKKNLTQSDKQAVALAAGRTYEDQKDHYRAIDYYQLANQQGTSLEATEGIARSALVLPNYTILAVESLQEAIRLRQQAGQTDGPELAKLQQQLQEAQVKAKDFVGRGEDYAEMTYFAAQAEKDLGEGNREQAIQHYTTAARIAKYLLNDGEAWLAQYNQRLSELGAEKVE